MSPYEKGREAFELGYTVNPYLPCTDDEENYAVLGEAFDEWNRGYIDMKKLKVAKPSYEELLKLAIKIHNCEIDEGVAQTLLIKAGAKQSDFHYYN